ncbi:hypothetical protein Agub_g1279 [Astrephomene gubernaculifera]|uniref:Uncharacterized protein n=1 Tax=Astrephomene gubernaculifera TaxID=47775 RepID=A0AAD3DHB9_9CHLO|nr:hypothetical protein Agub_g1279 [Astrephomene gubernaculifera]
MAPVDVELVAEIFDATNAVLDEGLNAAITAALNVCGIPDPGFVGWVVGKIVKELGFDPERAALAIAVCLEYAKRTHSLTRGLRLRNRCTLCRLKGHNSQNHTDEIDEWLANVGLASSAEEVSGFLEAVGLSD